jgi:hypothetical protein
MPIKDVGVDFACTLVHLSPGLILDYSLSLRTAVCKRKSYEITMPSVSLCGSHSDF